jgi:subtilisin family serine protease
VVAVLDTGVNYNQEDLAASMWNGGPSFPNHGNDFVDADLDPMDFNGHGTHVAGIIGAVGNNGKGTTGVCQKASIMAVRVLDAAGSGSDASIIQGVNFAIAHGARVLNMSLGGGGPFDQAFSDAITAAQGADVVVVVAAGNERSDNDAVSVYPCNFAQTNLVCVAALDPNFALASFSNFGAASVDVGAPGANILSTVAGAETAITDNFGGGVLNWTTSGGGWAYGSLAFTSGPAHALINPATFPLGTYADNADNRVYKTFNLTGSVAILNFAAQVTIQAGDSLNINYRSGGGDPFAGGVPLQAGSGGTGGFAPFSFDISPCISAACSVGFQLLSDASGAAQGSGIVDFSIRTLLLNGTTYKIETGTSMASPEVAGLAAMLRAYHPRYTYADTVKAIKNGGRSVPSLAGKTTSGKAIDVMSSLAYINPPTGLAVQ